MSGDIIFERVYLPASHHGPLPVFPAENPPMPQMYLELLENKKKVKPFLVNAVYQPKHTHRPAQIDLNKHLTNLQKSSEQTPSHGAYTVRERKLEPPPIVRDLEAGAESSFDDEEAGSSGSLASSGSEDGSGSSSDGSDDSSGGSDDSSGGSDDSSAESGSEETSEDGRSVPPEPEFISRPTARTAPPPPAEHGPVPARPYNPPVPAHLPHPAGAYTPQPVFLDPPPTHVPQPIYTAYATPSSSQPELDARTFSKLAQDPHPVHRPAPSLSELNVPSSKVLPNLDSLSSDELDLMKRELLYKLDVLRRQGYNIPEYSMHSDFKTMKGVYDVHVKHMRIDKSAATYKRYMFIGFILIQFGFTRLLGVDMSGFVEAQSQCTEYDDLLMELGEKSYVDEESNYPVELRLLLTFATQTVMFLGVRTFTKVNAGGDSQMLGMIMNLMSGLKPPQGSAGGNGTFGAGGNGAFGTSGNGAFGTGGPPAPSAFNNHGAFNAGVDGKSATNGRRMRGPKYNADELRRL